MQIYPSILETSKESFDKKLGNLLPHFNHFQIDITDGLFVPEKTVQIEELDAKDWKTQSEKTFEFHLMVENFESEIEKINQLTNSITVTSILIHLGSLNTKYKMLNTKYHFGIVLNPEDEVLPQWDIIKSFEIIQLMTVHPGRQGSPFVPEVLNKISQLRAKGYAGKIILDGAMNDETLAQVLAQKFWPDAICPGSFFTEDIQNRLAKLVEMVRLAS